MKVLPAKLKDIDLPSLRNDDRIVYLFDLNLLLFFDRYQEDLINQYALFADNSQEIKTLEEFIKTIISEKDYVGTQGLNITASEFAKAVLAMKEKLHSFFMQKRKSCF